MIPGILHKCTLHAANLKQIGGLIKNSPRRAAGWGGGLNNLSDLIDTTAVVNRNVLMFMTHLDTKRFFLSFGGVTVSARCEGWRKGDALPVCHN